MLVASTAVVGFGFRSGKLRRENVFRFAPESDRIADIAQGPSRAKSGGQVEHVSSHRDCVGPSFPLLICAAAILMAAL
jgi:hypothetical protein